jgi:hypothetical protein
MKKYMIADLVKDLTDAYLEDRALRIKELTDQFNITFSDASKIVDNYNDYDTQDLIAKAMEEYKLNLGDAEMFVDDHPNESEWAEYEDAAEAMGVDITDVEDDDVENLNDIWDLGGSRGKSYFEIDTSLGKAFIYYALGQYYLLVAFDEGNPANYPISKSEVSSISSASSFGTYFNQEIRTDDKYSDIPGAWGCIGPNSDSPKRLMTAKDKAKLPQDLQLLV